MSKYYNKRYQAVPNLKKGDKVYLLRKNVKTKRPSDKLDFKKIGLFEIIEKLGEVTYRLKILKTRINTTFYVVLLELVLKNAIIREPEDEIKLENLDAEEKDYLVEKILDYKRFGYQLKYLVKQEGYGNKDN